MVCLAWGGHTLIVSLPGHNVLFHKLLLEHNVHNSEVMFELLISDQCDIHEEPNYNVK